MIVVIQCAATKRPGAGCLQSAAGKPVLFVADPASAPADGGYLYARPDDLSDTGVCWRDRLLDYNKNPGNNPLGLYPAWRLYANRIYEQLVERFGVERVYIVSAGWGLVRADFLTPAYDITFSQAADRYKRRKGSDTYGDICMVPDRTDEPIMFFGSKSYVPLFCTLTGAVTDRRIIFYNSATVPEAPGCTPQRFVTATRTNWQYECAKALLDGVLRVPEPL